MDNQLFITLIAIVTGISIASIIILVGVYFQTQKVNIHPARFHTSYLKLEKENIARETNAPKKKYTQMTPEQEKAFDDAFRMSNEMFKKSNWYFEQMNKAFDTLKK